MSQDLFLPAEQTGLMPKFHTVHKNFDYPEKDHGFRFSQLDFSMSPVSEERQIVSSEQMFEMADEYQVIGSLGFAQRVLQAEHCGGYRFIRRELRRSIYVLFPRTKIQSANGIVKIPSLHVDSRNYLQLTFLWLPRTFLFTGNGPCVRFVRYKSTAS